MLRDRWTHAAKFNGAPAAASIAPGAARGATTLAFCIIPVARTGPPPSRCPLKAIPMNEPPVVTTRPEDARRSSWLGPWPLIASAVSTIVYFATSQGVSNFVAFVATGVGKAARLFGHGA